MRSKAGSPVFLGCVPEFETDMIMQGREEVYRKPSDKIQAIQFDPGVDNSDDLILWLVKVNVKIFHDKNDRDSNVYGVDIHDGKITAFTPDFFDGCVLNQGDWMVLEQGTLEVYENSKFVQEFIPTYVIDDCVLG